MKLKATHDEKTFEIIEDLPDIGWYVYAYDSSGHNTHDYLQDDLEMAKRCAFEEFGVPYNAWMTDDYVKCFFCGQKLKYVESLRITLEFGIRPLSRTVFSHKTCLLNNKHETISISDDLKTT